MQVVIIINWLYTKMYLTPHNLLTCAVSDFFRTAKENCYE